MSGPKRNPDKINTIGVVVVGICGAVLVYVSIVALQAFYMNDTSEIQSTADYGGQETPAASLKADQIEHITQPGKNSGAATYRIPISAAISKIAEGVKTDPSHLVPALPPSTKPTIDPVFGRPKLAAPPATPPAGGTEGAGSGAAAGSGAPAAGSGATTGAALPAAPMTSTAGANVPGTSSTGPATAGSMAGSAAPKGHVP